MENAKKKISKGRGEIMGKMLRILLDHPTSSKEFEAYGIKRRISNHNLKKFKEWEIVKRLKDDRYALINYSYGENKIGTADEIEKIQNYILWICWINENFHKRDFKKWFFEKGIETLKYNGTDSDRFSNLINNQKMPPINEILEFSKKFSTLVIRVEEIIEGSTAHYIFSWNDEIKKLVELPMHKQQDRIEPWDDGGEITLLRKLDVNQYNKYRDLFGKENLREYALSKIYDFTQSYIPSDDMLIDLLVLLKDHTFTKNNKDMILRILLEFLQKSKDVKPISEEISDKIGKEISGIAFNPSTNFNNELRWHAFEIIKILNRPSTIEKAMEYFLHLIKNGYDEGSCINLIYAWLAKSPEIRANLVEEVEKILIDTKDEKVKDRCYFFFQLSKNTNNQTTKKQ